MFDKPPNDKCSKLNFFRLDQLKCVSSKLNDRTTIEIFSNIIYGIDKTF